MWSLELIIGAILSVVLFAAVGAGAYVFIVKRRLEESRAAALLRTGKEEPALDLEALSQIERAIYASEVFWKDASGLIQERVFKELNFLAEGVERFNRSLSSIPGIVDNRVPPAVVMMSSAIEDSAGTFRQVAVTFSRAAESISQYGASYTQQLSELRATIVQFSKNKGEFDARWLGILDDRLGVEREFNEQQRVKQAEFDNRWMTLLDARLEAEMEVIESVKAKQKDFESRLEAMFKKRLEAEQNLILSINEKAAAIRNGRVILG